MNASLRRLPLDFSQSAAYPLYAIDPSADQAWVLHFDRDDYFRASFLDQRALQHREVSGWKVSGAELDEAVAPAAPPPLARLQWLFHIGHCGSTLVSRLLDLVPGTLGLREPLPLLTLAHERDASRVRRWLPRVRQLLARGFADTRAVVVKPTSVVTALADRLLPEGGYACLLWVDLETWLATMLRAEALVDASLATEQVRGSARPSHAPAETAAQRLARLWLGEQMRWLELAVRPDTGPRLVDLDFAEVLADPTAATARLAGHFGLPVPADLDVRIAESGVLRRYAKSIAQPFDASTRQAELSQALGRHASAIAAGLRWAHDEMRFHDLLSLEPRLRPSR